MVTFRVEEGAAEEAVRVDDTRVEEEATRVEENDADLVEDDLVETRELTPQEQLPYSDWQPVPQYALVLPLHTFSMMNIEN